MPVLLGLTLSLMGYSVCSTTERVEPGDIETFLNQRQALAQVLEDELSKQEIWTDPERRAVLVSYLRAAKALRLSSVAPILVKHIRYSPLDEEDDRITTVRERYPVTDVLVAIGLPAVPHLLAELAMTDGVDRIWNEIPELNLRIGSLKQLMQRAALQQKYQLLVGCLIDIYSPGGYGPALARQRIELECRRATGQQKEDLLRLLEHPRLKR